MSITGVELQFVDSLLQTQTIHLNLTDKGNQDKALAWLNALQKVTKFDFYYSKSKLCLDHLATAILIINML